MDNLISFTFIIHSFIHSFVHSFIWSLLVAPIEKWEKNVTYSPKTLI